MYCRPKRETNATTSLLGDGKTLLWMGDQLVAETYAPCAIRSHGLSRRAAADVRFRPRGHGDRHVVHKDGKYCLVC